MKALKTFILFFWHQFLSVIVAVKALSPKFFNGLFSNTWFLLRVVEHQKAQQKKKFQALRHFPNGADIVICIHNAAQDVKNCLDSVARHTNLNHHSLILIDDGSQDETAHLVRSFAAQNPSTYIRHETAKGYTVSANVGLKTSQKEFVVLLNSDTLVTPGWIDGLIQCANSAPQVACVGPFSNAASWQSIPKLMDDRGQWLVNELPNGKNLDQWALLLSEQSYRLYPEMTFLNGFCLLITRKALLKTGYLDEKSFPRGYGEEDDFVLRTQKLGFKCLLADDVYVYHAKSKSFTPQGRLEIVEKSKQKLRAKHGTKHIKDQLSLMQNNEDLLKVRERACMCFEGLLPRTSPQTPRLNNHLKLAWLVPHLKPVGGIRRAIEMTNRLTLTGIHCTLGVKKLGANPWLSILSQVRPILDILEDEFDVVLTTDPTEVEYFLKMKAKQKIVYHLGAYHLYRFKGPRLEKFYSLPPEVLQLANSHWTAEQIRQFYPDIKSILPGGIRKNTFKPIKAHKNWDVVFYGSIRPHKGTSFVESATQGWKTLMLDGVAENEGDLALAMSSAKVFVSGCQHEGFNFLPLEAMACGTPVVMTDDGGSREYTQNLENCLLVPVGDAQALRAAVSRLLTDKELRAKLISNGLRTAERFDWNEITSRFSEHLLPT